MQPDPLQLPHAGENIILCYTHAATVSLEITPDYKSSSSPGVGGKSVSIGISRSSLSFPPGERSSTAVPEGIHGGCDIALPLMWVVKSDAI